MDSRPVLFDRTKRPSLRVPAAQAALACLLALLFAAQAHAGGQGSSTGGLGTQQLAPPIVGSASVTLEECVTATVQEQRAIAFSAEMTAIPGTVRMAMRIDLEERAPGELEFHTVTSAGLGVWRSSDPKVKFYKYLKQVTNVSAPAVYRGSVRFRWLNAKGHAIKRAERLTSRCVQPEGQSEPSEASPPSGTKTTNSLAAVPAA